MARSLVLVLFALLALPALALADGDPASDVLVFPDRDYFLPYAPQASAASQARIDAATSAAYDAGYQIKVAVISGPGDLGAVPQMAGQPQKYAEFLGKELAFAYTKPLLIVMPEGYGLYGPADATVKAAVAALPKPKSGDPTDLVNAAADAVKAASGAAGHPIEIVAAAAPAAPAKESGGSDTIVYVVGGTVAVVLLLVGLVLWVRRAPAARAS